MKSHSVNAFVVFTVQWTRFSNVYILQSNFDYNVKVIIFLTILQIKMCPDFGQMRSQARNLLNK